mmetsp:Transcript_20227/g.47279  ORF Transcript_20227/g.47279 Transcript_20227/m.47279 type:complete len:341 (+) Transcript_20227:1-1023(+)
MEPWMAPDALAACGESTEGAKPSQTALGRNPDPGFWLPGKHPDVELLDGPPSIHGTLWNSMVAPLLSLPVATFYWYQGESNAGAPLPFMQCFPAMITSWRQHWTEASNTTLPGPIPFIFFQLAPWPALDNGMISTMRFAQMSALELPAVGMVVSADKGDAAGAFHPIHPPVKQELSRRAAMVTANLLYGDTSFPLQGPQVVAVTFDYWDASWGDYHYGTGAGSYVCHNNSGFTCGGVRIKFDQEIEIAGCGTSRMAQEPGDLNSFDNGFVLWDKDGGSQFQPAELTGVVADDPTTLQLNVTWVWGNTAPSLLAYAVSDYPVMRVYNSFGQPAMPFKALIG